MKRYIKFAALGLLVFFLVIFLWPFRVVQAGNRGIVTLFGSIQQNVLDEGVHIVNPLAKVKEVSVRTQKYEVANASAASKDLQSVTTTVALNYHIDETNLIPLFRDVGLNYGENIVTPAISEAVKASTAKYTAEELITKRDLVKGEMLDALRTRLASSFITVDNLSITNFDFSESFNAAIEAKVTAEQDALASKNKLEQIKYEAEQTKVSAEAQAESIRIQAEALKTNPELVNLKAVEKWDGKLPENMYGTQVPFIISTK